MANMEEEEGVGVEGTGGFVCGGRGKRRRIRGKPGAGFVRGKLGKPARGHPATPPAPAPDFLAIP